MIGMSVYQLTVGVDTPLHLGEVEMDETGFTPFGKILELTGCSADNLHLMTAEISNSTLEATPPAIAELYMTKMLVACFCCNHKPKRAFLVFKEEE